jgi:hypothetical protein
VQWMEAAWRNMDGNWVVTELTEQVVIPQRNRIIKWRLAYANFKPNAPVSAASFTLDSLGLPRNSRILDRRPNATQRIYHYIRDADADKRLDNLLDRVKALPTRPQTTPAAGIG